MVYLQCCKCTNHDNPWLQRNVGWSWAKDYHDWYTYSIAMVYLRYCKSCLQASSSTSTINARIIKKKVGSSKRLKHEYRIARTKFIELNDGQCSARVYS